MSFDREQELQRVKKLCEEIGFGNVIQTSVRLWDEHMEQKHGIKGHGRSWLIAAAEVAKEAGE